MGIDIDTDNAINGDNAIYDVYDINNGHRTRRPSRQEMTPVSWSQYAAVLRGTRRHPIDRWVLAGCFVAMILSGCVPAHPDDPGVPTATGSVTPVSVTPTSTPPTPAPTAPTTSGTPGTGTPTSGPTTTPPPPGTVVPFRTVTRNGASGRRIGLVAPTGSDAFGQEVTASIITQVTAAGADLIRCDPGADASLALDCARRMATQQVDGWIVLQPGDLGSALCDAGPQRVPLIVIAGAPLDCQTASVGADDRRAGFLAGRALGRTARSHTSCRHDAFVIVTNGAEKTVSADRVEGIREGFTAVCPDGPTHEMLLDAGTQDLAYDSFSTALTGVAADADVLAVAVNDAAALGVAAAVPESRREHVTVVAIGADQRARCEIIANRHWIGDAALFPDRYGEVVVPALLDALGGRSVPPRMFIESSFLSAADVAARYDIADCPGP